MRLSMPDATAALFDRLAARGREPLLARTTGTLRLELAEGGRTETWLLAIAQGDLTVAREHGEADCVMRCDRALFNGIAAGETNLMAAVLRQAVSIEGRPELFVLFQRLLPGPPPAAA